GRSYAVRSITSVSGCRDSRRNDACFTVPTLICELRAPPGGSIACNSAARHTGSGGKCSPCSAGSAAVRTGDDLEQVPVGIGEVHAPSAVVVVDLPGTRLHRIGPVIEALLADAAVDLV